MFKIFFLSYDSRSGSAKAFTINEAADGTTSI